MGILIKNGRVLDPASGKDGIFDVLVKDGMIFSVDKNIPASDNEIIDAAGCFVMPDLWICMCISGNRDLNIRRQLRPGPQQPQKAE